MANTTQREPDEATRRTLPYFSLAAVWVAIIWAFSQMPNALEPTLWAAPSPLAYMNGTLTPNAGLRAVVKAPCGETGSCTAPESLAIDPTDGTIYTSLADGRIVQLTDQGVFIRVVFFSGGFINQHPQTPAKSVDSTDAPSNTTGVGVAGNEGLMRWCQREALAHRLAWNTPGERKCGRPLGIRLVKTLFSKQLFFVDAYHGLFRWDILDIVSPGSFYCTRSSLLTPHSS